ncbi:hypothetical protein HZH68_016899 [Vespula germanica]|uniref:Uncharacterized protein n=1 Tax=Vespula germanica TaxID=30212 RepID=A0A834J6J0_VESGE|nr:hypothetical protein HZH68_016899 [Vespula germanica]
MGTILQATLESDSLWSLPQLARSIVYSLYACVGDIEKAIMTWNRRILDVIVATVLSPVKVKLFEERARRDTYLEKPQSSNHLLNRATEFKDKESRNRRKSLNVF